MCHLKLCATETIHKGHRGQRREVHKLHTCYISLATLTLKQGRMFREDRGPSAKTTQSAHCEEAESEPQPRAFLVIHLDWFITLIANTEFASSRAHSMCEAPCQVLKIHLSFLILIPS